MIHKTQKFNMKSERRAYREIYAFYFFAYFWKKWLKNYWHFVTGDKDNYCFIYKDKVYKLKREAVSGIVGSVLVKEKIDSRFWIDNRNSIETIRQKTVKEFSDKYADEFTEILKAAEEIELK